MIRMIPYFEQKETTFLSIFRPKPSSEELLLEEFATWARKSRGEHGCLIFDLYRVQGEAKVLYLHEVWEDGASFEAHASSIWTSRFRAMAAQYLECPSEAFELRELF